MGFSPPYCINEDDTADDNEVTEYVPDDVFVDAADASPTGDPYLDEFAAFYANYDEGYSYLYHSEEQGDVYDDDGYEAYEEEGNDGYGGEED